MPTSSEIFSRHCLSASPCVRSPLASTRNHIFYNYYTIDIRPKSNTPRVIFSRGPAGPPRPVRAASPPVPSGWLSHVRAPPLAGEAAPLKG